MVRGLPRITNPLAESFQRYTALFFFCRCTLDGQLKQRPRTEGGAWSCLVCRYELSNGGRLCSYAFARGCSRLRDSKSRVVLGAGPLCVAEGLQI